MKDQLLHIILVLNLTTLNLMTFLTLTFMRFSAMVR